MKRLRKILRFTGWAMIWLAIIYIIFLRYFLMHWGTTVIESRRNYTGDSIVIKPDYVNILAVSVDRPAADVWPWIAQMGVNKGGFYTYTWLENIFGCDLKNANSIHGDWQEISENDYEPVCMSAAKSNMPGWLVAKVIPGRALVYKSSVDSSWSMGYYIDSVSATSSRLITRMRYKSPKTFWEYTADKVWMEWAHCIMQKGSINGIRKRAEKDNL